jgi:hypothetical protein
VRPHLEFEKLRNLSAELALAGQTVKAATMKSPLSRQSRLLADAREARG